MNNEKPNIIYFDEQYISDGIGDEYKEWHRKPYKLTYQMSGATKVFIDSPTGTGKTSFVMDKLLPYAIEKGRSILYLCNRTALKEQVERALINKLSQLFKEYQEPELASEEKNFCIYSCPGKLDIFTIANYQSIVTLMNNNQIPTPFYVIMDESHFFIEDSMFNYETKKIWDRLINGFANSVMIFMSATAEDIENFFVDDMKNVGVYHPQFDIYQHFYKNDIRIYKNMKKVFSYKLLCYQKYDEIIGQIKKSSPNEKWLIFVNSKEDGKDIQNRIKRETKRSVSYITADSKKTKTWEKLVTYEKFSTDVLIVTKVADNGINIKDVDVKNIVLPFCDYTDFMQMMGRKRIDSKNSNNLSEKIRLYIQLPCIQTINTRLMYLKPLIPVIEAWQFINGISNFHERERRYYEFIEDLRLNTDQIVKNFFRFDKNGLVDCNTFSIHKIHSTISNYQRLSNSLYPTAIYFNMIYEWLNLPVDSAINHIYSENCIDIVELIAEFKNKVINEEETEGFYAAFQYYYKQECHKRFADDKEQWKRSQDIKKGKRRRKSTINKSLALLRLPYEIKKKNNCWILRDKV